MAKFLVMWHINPMAPLPTDTNESIQFNEMMFAQMDRLLETGEAQEFGFFSNGTSGYAITGGEPHDEMGGRSGSTLGSKARYMKSCPRRQGRK